MRYIILALLTCGCQFIQDHPGLIQEAEDIGEKILELELAQIAQNSSIMSSLESNHCYGK